MSWTMPHRTLQFVAFLLVLASAVSFAFGVISTPPRAGRLPGEKAAGGAQGATVINAQEATPLSNERIEGPPPPSPEETAKAQAQNDAAEADEESAVAAANTTPPPPPQIPLLQAPVGNAASAEAPPADEPPH